MMFDFSDDGALYAALLARDARFDGRAYVGVTSTGVFCRLTCPARKPKRENCVFFETMGACIEAGFRACKRCHPMAPAAQADPAIAALLAGLRDDPARRWLERDVIAMGFDPSTVRRAFKRHFGMTFLEMARLTRLRTGAAVLPEGRRVIDAQMEASYDSPAAFRRAFANWLGLSPSKFVQNATLRADWIETKLGPMIAVSDKHALHLLEFAERKALPGELKRLYALAKGSLGFGRFAPTDQIETEMAAFMDGRSADFHTRLAPLGTPFTQEVWRALRDIPAGETRSYGEVAKRMGRPEATRAVARANGANPIAIVIPCHRVIGADGALTGYGGGLWRKQALIEMERGFAQRKGTR
ncbi:bifunctional transcriptional activator/DNA repair protein Ada [Sulfitobacter sp. M57]|uniref:bifunctional transcriptional activator/DNA repair enzyme AdaA n=1 Tax=unclassified Sulfitobacter TaxID=196795 RepID=UPI0023E0A284|nr:MULTISPECIES: trifunctional transcriptional activator/DNA repair protein Ada/methylated-DNA--[protein]-cysteine S-methyltransferase [unclassified Sulfitobacter]MDF3413141.1 bifunctional transcriptional activator/DNA repair protein Ada [Sulfitobacter sp. KE5]MDF3421576.1 bifunctional transcriptional activator/DNA repair protein Ada [Sulfitobacter sp. KE43]MDF3431690.1 bifunctional transcriptional activator/DNA repair protein Ada [Sulfitobacter sp. KE42]MDF3457331.1 bifunctional transcriptiona